MSQGNSRAALEALLQEVTSLDDMLLACKKPVVLYGMGDGADKVLAVLSALGIAPAGVFASDGFVRGQTFHGMEVETLAALEARLGDFLVLLSFATYLPTVLDSIQTVARRHRLLAPDVPVCGGGRFTAGFMAQHLEELAQVYGALADGESRRVFLDVLRYKLSGDTAYLLRSSATRDSIYRELVCPGSEEYFVDAGAYNGDTVVEFLGHTAGQCRGILALEPDRRNFRKLEAAVQGLGIGNLRLVNAGAWDCRDMLTFSQTSGRRAGREDSGTPNTPVDSIDNLLAGRAATLVKYDVEGAEYRALLGSSETITRFSPKLMVSAYHRSEDIFTLPLLALSMNPSYRLYLRRPPYVPAWDLLFILLPG